MEEEFNRVDTIEQTDRKCPQCGATMDYSPQSGGMFCPFCEYKEEIPSNAAEGEEDSAEELDFQSAEKRGNCDWGVSKKTVICKSCGAESIYDALDVSNECPYCGSNQVMEANDINTLAPNGVCPFVVTDKQAGQNFTSWLKGKLFTPSKAKKSARPEGFKGVYLPYWTFDAQTQSTYTAKYGRNRTVRNKDGSSRTVTDWFPTAGSYSKSYDDELVLASNRYDTNLLKTVEPFDTADNKTYRPEYVAGFISERYSVGLDAGWESAKESLNDKLKEEISQQIRDRHRADKVSNLVVKTRFSNITYKYLMLPLWLSSFQYKNKVYQFMVNGQTGKVGGKAPVSALRVAIAVVIGVAIIAGLFLLLNQ